MDILTDFAISFSDTAKFALIAKNIIIDNGFSTDFSFWGINLFSTFGVLPVHTYLISLFFRMFGVSDISVILTSSTFFVLSAVIVYILSNKIFKSKLVGILSSVTVLSSYPLIDLAKNGASEITFIFLILLSYLFISFKSQVGNISAVLSLILLYLTRPHAFIFIIGIVLYYLLLNFETKKALKYFVLAIVLGVIVDKFLISPLEGKYFTYSILDRGINATTQIGASQSPSDQLRGLVTESSLVDIVKKVFYNLYNFYNALPEIINPYLFTFFILGIFSHFAKATRDRVWVAFEMSVLFVTLLTFLVTALTIPFYRYIHPVVPLVYIVAVGTLVQIIRLWNVDYGLWNKHRALINNLISIFLILLFAVGQTLGIIFLDSRFEKRMKNIDKAPIYVEMSYKLKEITNKDMVIVTNLDTWGSWYGERKTIWFPLEPSMILPVQDNIDAIYLTSYKMDDENYYMGEAWREIFESPEKQTILSDFKFVGEYEFKAENNYERENGRSILLVRYEKL